MSIAAFLRNVPVLADLSEDLLSELAEQAGTVRFSAGEWILREGEPAQSAYIIRSGRVEVVDEAPPETLIRVLRRGDVLGELALLRQGPRSASARARRDTELVELTRQAFEGLIQDAPDFALGLVRSIGAQLAASRSPVAHAALPGTIGVVGLDAGADVSGVAERLERALSRYVSTARLETGDLAAIDRAVESADRVILAGREPIEDEWTELCVREVDLILAVSTGRPTEAWLRNANALHGCELLVLAPHMDVGLSGRIEPREAQVVADPGRLDAALAILARRLTGRSLGIVLSGGGARAFAHLGVLEELTDAGLRFDRVAGVSLGSLVAGAVAAGFELDYIRERFERTFAQRNPTNDYALPVFSMIRGARTRELLRQELGDRRIEELPYRFFCLSCDLVGRQAVFFRTGPLADAVYASLAIPGVFPPVATDTRLLVDGGVINNMPVEAMARTAEGPVIAVDVGSRPTTNGRGPGGLADRVDRRLRRMLTGNEAYVPRLGETIVRTVMVGSADTVAEASLHADLLITPEVEGIGLMDWKAIDHARELGRRAAREALADKPELQSRLSI
jgi:NTE family protein